MFLYQFLLVFLLFSQIVVTTMCSSLSSWSSSSPSTCHTCLEDQRLSLLQFKKTFTITGSASLDCESDSHPKMVFWNESTDCCSWEGVTCDWLHGRVIGLDLTFTSSFTKSIFVDISQSCLLSSAWEILRKHFSPSKPTKAQLTG